ncbi:hypothetical protein Golax_002349 [Gossypium laxum]|uniref:Uncharacterized protein n=1 Tax=Gossypium laxum TaxID=34288 RepID=A0A7J9AQZ3_9ROSI|nr:hypothetical protein [Gossypium laxum]
MWNGAPLNGSNIKLNFDAAFDEAQAKSASGVVARNASGEILASKTMVHRAVASSFVAEAHTQRKLVRVEGENQIEDWLMKAFRFWDEIKEVNDGLLVFGNYFLGTGTVGINNDDI